MAAVFDIDGAAGVFAMYDEPPSGPVDAPLYNPMAHLSRIKVHSELDYLQAAFETSASLSLPYVAKPSSGWSWSTWSFEWYPTAYSADHLIYTHNLGYVPFLVPLQNQFGMEPGFPIQTNGSGGRRYLTFYATDTAIRARETVDTGNGDLAALSLSFSAIILRKRARSSSGVLFEATADGVVAGEDSFNSGNTYLRAVAAGQSPYVLAGGKNIDASGGVCRVIQSASLMYDDAVTSPNNTAYYDGSLTTLVTRAVAT